MLLRESAAKPSMTGPRFISNVDLHADHEIRRDGETHLELAVSEAAGRLVPAPMVLENDKSVANHLVALNFVGCARQRPVNDVFR